MYMYFFFQKIRGSERRNENRSETSCQKHGISESYSGTRKYKINCKIVFSVFNIIIIFIASIINIAIVVITDISIYNIMSTNMRTIIEIMNNIFVIIVIFVKIILSIKSVLNPHNLFFFYFSFQVKNDSLSTDLSAITIQFNEISDNYRSSKYFKINILFPKETEK